MNLSAVDIDAFDIPIAQVAKQHQDKSHTAADFQDTGVLVCRQKMSCHPLIISFHPADVPWFVAVPVPVDAGIFCFSDHGQSSAENIP